MMVSALTISIRELQLMVQGVAGQVHGMAGQLARHAARLPVASDSESGDGLRGGGAGRLRGSGGGGRRACQLLLCRLSALGR